MEYGRLTVFRLILICAFFLAAMGCASTGKAVSSENDSKWKEKVLFVDERKINKKSTFDIYIANPDGTDLKVLVENAINPVSSPDGKKVAFVSANGIGVINSDGTERKNLVKADKDQSQDFGIYGLQWSPDSRKIAYVANYGERSIERSELRIVTIDGDRRILKKLDKNKFYGIDWSPDNGYLLILALDASYASIINMETTKESPLDLKLLKIIDPSDFISFLFFYDNEKLIYYGENKGLWKINKDGTKKEKLTEKIELHKPETLSLPLHITPDKKVRFVTDELDSEGNKRIYKFYELDVQNKSLEKKFEKHLRRGTYFDLKWSPISNKVLFAGPEGLASEDLKTEKPSFDLESLSIIKTEWNRMPSEIIRVYEDFIWLYDISYIGGK